MALSQADEAVLVSALGISLRGVDVKTLCPNVWVNDQVRIDYEENVIASTSLETFCETFCLPKKFVFQVINLYMYLIMERGKRPSFPDVYCFNTFFLSGLLKNGYDYVKRWTKNVRNYSSISIEELIFHI